VATSKLIAKLASEAAKPKASLSGPIPGAGVVEVAPGDELAFLHPLPVRALWGVGPATARRLDRFGVVTVGDLAAVPVASLVAALGQAHGSSLHELAWARDGRPVVPVRDTKSIGHEETYRHDIDDLEHLRREAVRMADAVATRLRAAGLVGRTVTLKVRFADFATITRSSTAGAPVDTGAEIARVAVELLEQVDVTAGVRLLGVSVANLAEDAARQLSLEDVASWGDATQAVDAVRARFGAASVGPAALVGRDGLRVKRQGDTQWGPGSQPD
jgi:DNA polymerase-4